MISGTPKSPAMGRAKSPACLLESHTGKEQSQMFNKLIYSTFVIKHGEKKKSRKDELAKLHIPENLVLADSLLIFLPQY